jgi:hypothetical protein
MEDKLAQEIHADLSGETGREMFGDAPDASWSWVPGAGRDLADHQTGDSRQ